MKKWRIPAAILLCLALAGCAPSARTETDYTQFDQPFELTADFTRGSLTGSFLYSRSSPEQCALSYFAPQSLSGMCVKESAGEVTTEFLGILHEQERGALKNGNPIRAIGRALDAFRAEQPEGRALESGETEYTLSYGARIILSGGILRRIECPSEELIITVTGYTPLG